MGFNSGFKGLKYSAISFNLHIYIYIYIYIYIGRILSFILNLLRDSVILRLKITLVTKGEQENRLVSKIVSSEALILTVHVSNADT